MARLIDHELYAYMRRIKLAVHRTVDAVDGRIDGSAKSAVAPELLGITATPKPLGLSAPPSAETKTLTTPYTYLDYEMYRQAFKEGILLDRVAEHFGQPKEKVAELAADPDHGGQITISSLIEAMVGFELERDGIMGLTIIRGPKKTDLVDGWDRQWDVKAPPRIFSGFNPDAAYQSIAKKFTEFPENNIGILLCVSFMTLDDYATFLDLLGKNLLADRKYHIRQVNIEGILTKEDTCILSSQDSVKQHNILHLA